MKRFTWVPTWQTEASHMHRSIEVEFGDAYTQRAPDGLNPHRPEFQVAFNNVRSTKAKEILAFLEEHGPSTPFLWLPPEPYDVGTWVFVQPYSHRYEGYDNETIAVTFRRDFNPAPQCDPVVVTNSGGFVTMTCATAGAVIRWTRDGAAPTERTGTIYASAVASAAGVWRARAFHETLLPSQTTALIV